MPHTFDITALSRIGDEHVLAVEVACPPQRSHRGQRNDHRRVPALGRHRPRLEPGRHLASGARVRHRAGAHRPLPRAVPRRRRRRAPTCCCRRPPRQRRRRGASRVRTLVDGVVVAEPRALAGGRAQRGQLERSTSAIPQLWWPRALGDQPLTTIDVEVIVDGESSDRRARRTGLRDVALERLDVLGQRRAAVPQGRQPAADARRARRGHRRPTLRRDIELAVEAGLDVLRVHGHIATRPTVRRGRRARHAAAAGLPAAVGVRPIGARRRRSPRRAPRSTSSATTRRSCSGARTTSRPRSRSASRATAPSSRLRYVAGQQLPSWNKTVLDRWVKRSFEQRRPDPARACRTRGVLPHLPQLDGTDSHLYFGWYHGDVRDLDRLGAARSRAWCASCREFGAQAVPETADFIDPARLARPRLGRCSPSDHGLQKWAFDERVPPGQLRHVRRVAARHADVPGRAAAPPHRDCCAGSKYRPTGGFCVFALNDPAPVVSWSVLDHERVPKRGYRTCCSRACLPVIVSPTVRRRSSRAGDDLALDVHAVNDLRRRRRPGRRRRRRALGRRRAAMAIRWRGPAPTTASRSARSSSSMPDTLGALTFDLTLTAGDIKARNHYSTAVTVR